MKEENTRAFPAKDSYTPTEVGTLVESFRTDMSVIGERVVSLCDDVAELKTDMKEVKTRLTHVEDVLRIEIPSIHKRLDRLEIKTGL